MERTPKRHPIDVLKGELSKGYLCQVHKISEKKIGETPQNVATLKDCWAKEV